MKNFKTLSLAALMLGASVFAAEAANAEPRTRQVTVQNSQGKTATSTTTRNRTETGPQRTKSVETGAGYGGSKSVEHSYDAETGTRYRSSDVSTNSGKGYSADTAASCSGGACSRATTVAGANGQTVSGSTVRYVDENGNYVKQSGVTGPDGETASRDVVRNGEGEKTTTVTNPDGESRSRTRWITVE